MNSRLAFVIWSPLLTGVGAATTVIAPMLLDPIHFTRFALLNSVFSYLAEFDFGLSRLSDRMLPGQPNDLAWKTGGSLLFARYCVAGSLSLVGLLLVHDWLMLCAAAGGIAMLLSNGPLSFYRARADISRFNFATYILQFGLTLPRLLGLLWAGVPGSIVGLSLWTGACALVLNLPLISMVRVQWKELRLLSGAFPLFCYNALWLLYQFANRWISWGISDAHNAGLFAFGANLAVTAIGVLAVLTQPFYPRHLAAANPRSLARELYLLLVIAAACNVASTLFCRFALAFVFPNFTAAADVTSALLITTIPIGLTTWLIPLTIARSTHVFDILIIPISMLLMFGLMYVMNAYWGIIGQAWACLPSAVLLFTVQLAFVVRAGLLFLTSAVRICLSCTVVVALGAVFWSTMF